MILNEMLDHLNKVGSFDRVNNVPAFDQKTGRYKRMSKYARKGASDISGTYKGRPVYIEVKTPKAYKAVISYYKKIRSNIWTLKPTQEEKFKFHAWEQVIYLRDKHDNGAITFFSDSYHDALNKLEQGYINYADRMFLLVA